MNFYFLLEEETYHTSNLQTGKGSFAAAWPLRTQCAHPRAAQRGGAGGAASPPAQTVKRNLSGRTKTRTETAHTLTARRVLRGTRTDRQS